MCKHKVIPKLPTPAFGEGNFHRPAVHFVCKFSAINMKFIKKIYNNLMLFLLFWNAVAKISFDFGALSKPHISPTECS